MTDTSDHLEAITVDAPLWWKWFVGIGMGSLFVISRRVSWARKLCFAASAVHLTEAAITETVLSARGVPVLPRRAIVRRVLCWGAPCFVGALRVRSA